MGRKSLISTDNIIKKAGNFTFIVTRNLKGVIEIDELAKVHFPSFPTKMDFIYEFQRGMTLEESLKDMKECALASSCSNDVISVFDWALDESNLGYMMAVEKFHDEG